MPVELSAPPPAIVWREQWPNQYPVAMAMCQAAAWKMPEGVNFWYGEPVKERAREVS